MNETGKALLSVLDKALLKTEPDPTPQTTAFLAKLRKGTGNYPSGVNVDGRPVEFDDMNLTVSCIAAEAILILGRPVCAEEELSALRSLQAKMDALIGKAEEFSHTKVNDHIHRLRDRMAADVLAGRDLPEQVVTPSRDAVARDFRAKQAALTDMLALITHKEVVPLCQPIFQRFGDTVDAFMRNVEEGDRHITEAYGIAYHPSLLWKAAAHVAQAVGGSRLPREYAWATPRNLLQGLVKI